MVDCFSRLWEPQKMDILKKILIKCLLIMKYIKHMILRPKDGLGNILQVCPHPVIL